MEMLRATKKYSIGNGYTHFVFYKKIKTYKNGVVRMLTKLQAISFFFVARNYSFRKQIINHFIFI